LKFGKNLINRSINCYCNTTLPCPGQILSFDKSLQETSVQCCNCI